MCAWHPRVDACSGDSGGPLILPPYAADYANQMVIGVVSYGSMECAHEDAAGVCARVTKVVKWMAAKIQSGECYWH